MRVLHALHTSLPYTCGYSVRSNYILRFQRELGMLPAVVTSAQHPNAADAREFIDGVEHWRTPPLTGKPRPPVREWRLMSQMYGRLVEACEEWRPVLVHAHSPMLVGLPSLWAARRFGVPLVYEVRDLWENASVDRGKFEAGSLQYRAARLLESYVLRRADAVVTICENLRDELAARTNEPSRVHVVGNGVDTSGFDPSRETGDARQRLGLAGKTVLGYVGTFQPYEGLETLVSAMAEIAKAHPAAHLVITGSGGVEGQLRALAEQSPARKSITFTGRLPHSEVIDIYRLADVVVYPRLLTRTTALTTPLKPLEAMAMGCAVLASDVPAMLELIRPGLTGLTFEAGCVADLVRKCNQLLSAPDLRQQLGAAARGWVLQDRQWRNLIAGYGAIYEQAASKRQRRPGANYLRRWRPS